MRDHDSTVEEWRPIPGFVHYEASNLGRIRSLERVITVTRLGHTYQRTVGGCLIGTTPSATSTANYRTIGLCSIRAEAANSTEPVNHIARRWGISGTHCRRIVSRSAWGHI